MRNFQFETHLEQTEWARGKAMVEGRPSVDVAIPPEFSGPEGVWTPEHLFLSSLESCLLATYSFMARKAGIPILAYRSRTVGRLDKHADGLRFSLIEMFVQVEVDERADEALKVLRLAQENCPVHRSIRTPLELHPQVWTRATAPLAD